MNLHDASLSDLVAELRERLRHLTNGVAAGAGTRGPLGPAGRAALAARLLAVGLAERTDQAGRDAARALEDLADALTAAPAPLPGSVWEADLGRLARLFEELAAAWDRHDPAALHEAWSDLQQAGSRLWSPPVAPVAAADPTPRPAPGAAIWLLVTGSLRRATLQRRLADAGLAVECLADAAVVAARLGRERPAAVVCDDAAPDRHGTHLRAVLPPGAPPLVLVRGRPGRQEPGDRVWLPPYRVEELLATLRC